MRTTLLALAFALGTLFVAAPGRAQHGAPAVPPGYEAAPGAAIDLAVAASLAGDRRLALRSLREAERAEPGSPRLRLLRASIDWHLDPRTALLLGGSDVERLGALLDAADDERRVGIGLGIASAATGVGSLLTMLIAVLDSVQCTDLLFVPICGPTTPDTGAMAGAAVLGVTSLALMGLSIGVLEDACSRSHAVRDVLRVSGSASQNGASVSLSGTL